MSLKKAIQALRSLGLEGTEVNIYLYLAKKGPHEEKDIAKALNLTKNKLCFCLERLVSKEMVSIVPERSVKYSAIALEKVLDQYLKTRKEQVKTLKASREEFLSAWRSIIKDDHENS